MPKIWAIVPIRLPLIVRRCHACRSERFRTTGKFRVNAHHKRIDVWLLAICTGCGDTAKLSVLERVHVRSVRLPLDRLHDNDLALAHELLQIPAILRRNRIALDWDGAWRVDVDGADRPDDSVIDVSVRLAARIPIRPIKVIADGFGLRQSEVARLVAAGRLMLSVPLRGERVGDFTFTLNR
ncbi:DUF1062 domain-containing protein [Mycobacterium sp. LTG2003]